jgi:hypothetical protein
MSRRVALEGLGGSVSRDRRRYAWAPASRIGADPCGARDVPMCSDGCEYGTKRRSVSIGSAWFVSVAPLSHHVKRLRLLGIVHDVAPPSNSPAAPAVPLPFPGGETIPAACCKGWREVICGRTRWTVGVRQVAACAVLGIVAALGRRQVSAGRIGSRQVSAGDGMCDARTVASSRRSHICDLPSGRINMGSLDRGLLARQVRGQGQAPPLPAGPRRAPREPAVTLAH